MDLGAGELLVIAVLVLVLIMPTKVPSLARSLGEAMHELRRSRAEADPAEPSAVTERSVVDPPPVVDESV
jgi:Sec-independent protein translocase protein TatA